MGVCDRENQAIRDAGAISGSFSFGAPETETITVERWAPKANVVLGFSRIDLRLPDIIAAVFELVPDAPRVHVQIDSSPSSASLGGMYTLKIPTAVPRDEVARRVLGWMPQGMRGVALAFVSLEPEPSAPAAPSANRVDNCDRVIQDAMDAVGVGAGLRPPTLRFQSAPAVRALILLKQAQLLRAHADVYSDHLTSLNAAIAKAIMGSELSTKPEPEHVGNWEPCLAGLACRFGARLVARIVHDAYAEAWRCEAFGPPPRDDRALAMGIEQSLWDALHAVSGWMHSYWGKLPSNHLVAVRAAYAATGLPATEQIAAVAKASAPRSAERANAVPSREHPAPAVGQRWRLIDPGTAGHGSVWEIDQLDGPRVVLKGYIAGRCERYDQPHSMPADRWEFLSHPEASQPKTAVKFLNWIDAPGGPPANNTRWLHASGLFGVVVDYDALRGMSGSVMLNHGGASSWLSLSYGHMPDGWRRLGPTAVFSMPEHKRALDFVRAGGDITGCPAVREDSANYAPSISGAAAKFLHEQLPQATFHEAPFQAPAGEGIALPDIMRQRKEAKQRAAHAAAVVRAADRQIFSNLRAAFRAVADATLTERGWRTMTEQLARDTVALCPADLDRDAFAAVVLADLEVNSEARKRTVPMAWQNLKPASYARSLACFVREPPRTRVEGEWRPDTSFRDTYLAALAASKAKPVEGPWTRRAADRRRRGGR